MSKIAILSPFYPWKWWISHHTACLADALIKKWLNTHVISFSRQYPRILYPGKTQKETWPNQFPNIPVSYIIDTLNPFTWWRTYRFVKRNHYSTFIFKYWHFYFAPLYIFLSFLLSKKNIKIVCIVDNLFSHEKTWLDTVFSRVFFQLVDVSITQSEIVDHQFLELFPLKKHFLIKHPVYEHFWEKINKSDAQLFLWIPDHKIVLLFFWFIRHYKGLDILLLSLTKALKIIPNLYLVIAGECFWDFSYYQKILDQNNLNYAIKKHLFYIPNHQVPIFFSASDFFVMPYRSATNSWVMEIAKFYQLPIIASSIEAFSPFSKEEGISLIDFSNTTEFTRTIQEKNSKKSSSDKNNSWEIFADSLVKFL